MMDHRIAARLVCALGMGMVGLAYGQQQGTVTYVYTDPQGTPLAESDAQGNITKTFDYTPYGSVATDTAPNGPGYTGHVNDPETNLVYMQARYYDPVTGHFLSVDPDNPKAGNAFNFNRYDYANNNPIRYTDPTGKVVHLSDHPETIVALINSRAVGTFGVDKSGNLMVVSSKGDTSKFSSTYSNDLKGAINAKETISVSISPTFESSATGKMESVDTVMGGGVTTGATKGGNQAVVISGNSNTNIKDVNGAPLRDAPADILAHELGGHAIPHVTGAQSGNAVTDENKIRSEVPGSGQRAPEPDHVE
ncbi:RHS repeat-associated core domain-containing protein [Dyella humi]|uniref:RHS repeat-associated core domain-containing protein n=1 Tax=Dyella humi TaxID=1770547 RepID=A0ABW8ILA7_9GAMM